MTDKNETVIALLGQPNSGKSTLFNALTGLKQHVGNWPGKTVEQKEGKFEYNGKHYVVADLPGTYSLSANSDEEMITRDYIASGKADVVCILADSSQLERSLYMLADFAGIEVPCFLVLNMSDVAKDQGKKIKVDAIRSRLGIPVVLFSATDKKDYSPFYEALTEAMEKKTLLNKEGLQATVMENIRIGKEGATDEEIMEAARLANCEEFVSKLPDGYNTYIGENGSELSGGERQRISIARAFLKDAPIILLDEATASLDAENESVIQEALSRLIKDKTVLIIAHRMRTVANADHIVVLKDGVVAEQGSPEELDAKDSIYKHMKEQQLISANWKMG